MLKIHNTLPEELGRIWVTVDEIRDRLVVGGVDRALTTSTVKAALKGNNDGELYLRQRPFLKVPYYRSSRLSDEDEVLPDKQRFKSKAGKTNRMQLNPSPDYFTEVCGHEVRVMNFALIKYEEEVLAAEKVARELLKKEEEKKEEERRETERREQEQREQQEREEQRQEEEREAEGEEEAREPPEQSELPNNDVDQDPPFDEGGVDAFGDNGSVMQEEEDVPTTPNEDSERPGKFALFQFTFDIMIIVLTIFMYSVIIAIEKSGVNCLMSVDKMEDFITASTSHAAQCGKPLVLKDRQTSRGCYLREIWECPMCLATLEFVNCDWVRSKEKAQGAGHSRRQPDFNLRAVKGAKLVGINIGKLHEFMEGQLGVQMPRLKNLRRQATKVHASIETTYLERIDENRMEHCRAVRNAEDYGGDIKWSKDGDAHSTSCGDICMDGAGATRSYQHRHRGRQSAYVVNSKNIGKPLALVVSQVSCFISFICQIKNKVF